MLPELVVHRFSRTRHAPSIRLESKSPSQLFLFVATSRGAWLVPGTYDTHVTGKKRAHILLCDKVGLPHFSLGRLANVSDYEIEYLIHAESRIGKAVLVYSRAS
jgi:hypothetical protein